MDDLVVISFGLNDADADVEILTLVPGIMDHIFETVQSMDPSFSTAHVKESESIGDTTTYARISCGRGRNRKYGTAAVSALKAIGYSVQDTSVAPNIGGTTVTRVIFTLI